MKYPTMLTLTAIALGTAVYATPALHLPVQMQQKTAEVGPNSTETDQGVVDHHVKKAGWLRLISGDDDDDDDDDEGDDEKGDDDECEDDDDDGCGDRNGKAAAPTGPVTPPQNGLFSTGKAPQVKSN